MMGLAFKQNIDDLRESPAKYISSKAQFILGMSSTVNRVIKNTGFLYAKMGITMFVTLYTTRVILNSLGASDFGIFNIVGGAIAMLGFLNGALASATQRFMSYSEGEGNKEKQKRIFNISFILHFIMSLLIGVILLIAGYFFFNGILDIPTERCFAAKVIYGSLIISTMFIVMTVPYDAVMRAHENMKFYAIVGCIESFLKLTVAVVTVYTVNDRLIVYGVSMACVPFIILTIMRIYCHRHYKECIISPGKYWNKSLMHEMVVYAGWNLTGSTATVITMQGVSIVLNSFWGVLANAAQGIANQLSGQIMAFSNSMLTALEPAIVKKEGANSRTQMLEASLVGNKFSYLLMAFFAIPFCIEAPYILKIWLKETPEYTVLFCRLILIRLSIAQLTVTFRTAIGAIGKIRYYTIVTSLIMISILPLACIFYYFKAPIYTIYLLLIFMFILLLISSTFFMKSICGLSIIQFIRQVFAPCICVSLATTFFGCIPFYFMNESLIRFLLVCATCVCSFILFCYTIALTTKEKQLILSLVSKIIKR